MKYKFFVTNNFLCFLRRAVIEQAVGNRQEAAKAACLVANRDETDKKGDRPTGAIKKRQAPKLPVEETEVTKRVTRAAAKVLTFS